MSKGKSKPKQCKIYVRNIIATISELEGNLLRSEEIDRQILVAMSLSTSKNQTAAAQLCEARMENNHLLNMLQLRGDEGNLMTRTDSVTSCSTMSLVHLQYKYEELLANYNGLLKMLEMRLSEVRSSHEENDRLKEEVEAMRLKLQDCEEEIDRLKRKIVEMKRRRNEKVSKLKCERDTLRLVHNRLVGLLDDQCGERDRLLDEQIRHSTSEKARLLQEIRKNNLLSYENFRLHQEIEYLQTMLKVRPIKTAESLPSRLRK